MTGFRQRPAQISATAPTLASVSFAVALPFAALATMMIVGGPDPLALADADAAQVRGQAAAPCMPDHDVVAVGVPPAADLPHAARCDGQDRSARRDGQLDAAVPAVERL